MSIVPVCYSKGKASSSGASNGINHCHRKGLVQLSESDSSKVRYPQFFKVFLPEHCSTTMKIPAAFVQRLTTTLPKKMVLRTRYGGIWPIMLSKMNDDLYIEKGWTQFVVDNAIEVGNFLVFKYNGLHIFDVLVFGYSACEKKQANGKVKGNK